MKKFKLFLFFFLLAANIPAQNSEWQTLQTDDGEFSLKMPAGCYSRIYIAGGFIVRMPKTTDRFHLKEMDLLSCFAEQTLMNVEIYQSDDARRAVKALVADLKIEGKKAMPNGNPDDDFYGIEHTTEKQNNFFSQYFVAGRKHVYVITIATRGLPNAATKAFTESLKFRSAKDNRTVGVSKTTGNFIFISSLKPINPRVVDETAEDKKSSAAVPPKIPENDPTFKKLLVLSLPKPSFTITARENKVKGNVSLRLNFGADGKINEIRIKRDLPAGLLREAVVAAMRIKYLPEEKDGEPRSSSQLIEYNFSVK